MKHCKRIWAGSRRAGLALVVALLAATAARAELGSVPTTSQQIVVDAVTGLAIGGIDPVSYFIDGEPRPGKAELEAIWSGAVWRFVNEGNRAAFLEAPDVYAPRYGGHCAFAAASGRAVDADPRIWTIRAGRLYLFYSYANRIYWLPDAEDLVAKADAAWPATEATLAR